MAIQPDTTTKYNRLREILSALSSVAVAYSGGVDSAFLAKAATETRGDNAYAILGISPTVARSEVAHARELAASFGLRLIEIQTDELSDPNYSTNPTNRCYFCKTELFQRIQAWCIENGVAAVCDGANADDKGDWRPGAQAALEKGVRSPLAEVGLTKAEIRDLSREMGLPTWDKPSIACLGSRFPYGTQITPEAIQQLDEAEDLLRALGFRQLRVRHHGEIARIEVEPQDIERVASSGVRDKIVEGFRRLGFRFVTLDLAGYRTGNMNTGIVEFAARDCK